MRSDETSPAAQRSVPDLYAALTEFAQPKEPESANSLSLHQGLWGQNTKTAEEALERAIRALVRGCRLGPGNHVLDAGCGVGGTAIALARTYGVRVTGLTNCAPHVEVATRMAQQRNVSHLVEFLYGDFMDLPFPDACFDIVMNQESFCYANDKPAFFQGVYRVLKPNGRWRALEVLTGGVPMPDEHRSILDTVRHNWRMPPFVAWQDLLAMLKASGFTEIGNRDVTAEALRWREVNSRRVRALLFLNPGIREAYPTLVEFLDGSVCFTQGLSEGVFTYHLLSGTRPT